MACSTGTPDIAALPVVASAGGGGAGTSTPCSIMSADPDASSSGPAPEGTDGAERNDWLSPA